jgi:hypothetical protein
LLLRAFADAMEAAGYYNCKKNDGGICGGVCGGSEVRFCFPLSSHPDLSLSLPPRWDFRAGLLGPRKKPKHPSFFLVPCFFSAILLRLDRIKSRDAELLA